MFDPAVLGTLLIGLESARSDARPTDPGPDPDPEVGRQAARRTERHEPAVRRDGAFGRRVGALLTSLLPLGAGYEKNQRR